MSKSDQEIYAKIGGDERQALIVDDADPIDRERPQSLITEEEEASVDVTSIDQYNWSLAYIRRPSGGTTCAFVSAGHIEAGDEPGTITVPEQEHEIRRAGTPHIAGNDITFLSLQRVDNSFVQRYVNRDGQSNELLITDDPLDGNLTTPAGDGNDPLYTHGSWFVCRDANNRDRQSNHCYETYVPEDALQFRDATRFDRPPVLINEGDCYAEEWGGPSSQFGVISTEVVRVSRNAVPASDERIEEIERNARQ